MQKDYKSTNLFKLLIETGPLLKSCLFKLLVICFIFADFLRMTPLEQSSSNILQFQRFDRFEFVSFDPPFVLFHHFCNLLFSEFIMQFIVFKIHQLLFKILFLYFNEIQVFSYFFHDR